MIKKEKSILIILLVLVVSFITAGFSFWIIVATPKSMVTSKYSVAYDSLPDVAYIWRSGAEFAKYKTVEEALSTAQANDTVYIIPGANPTVNSNCEVKSGVTLALPCNENKDILSKTANNVNQSHGEDKVAYLNPTKYRYCNMNISWGVTLTNNGTIAIGGFMSGGGGGYPLAAFTAGAYGQITMRKNSILQNNGVIECYGYIDEEKRDNGSQVINNSGSSITSPFTVYEHRGGSAFADLAGGAINIGLGGKPNLQSAAFNRFYMGNIIAKVSIKNGAQLLGYANLYAGDQHNETYIKIAGSGNSNLINVKSGSELRAKYNPDTQVTKIQLYGSAELNSLMLSIKYLTRNFTLSTNEVLFPISWYYNVELKRNLNGNKANVIFNQNVKILPGGSIVVDEGVTLTVGKMAVYDASFTTDTSKNTGTMAYVNGNATKIPAGELIVNGALNCSEFGGVVKSSAVGAKLSVGTAKISVKEVNTDTYTNAWDYTLSIKTGASTESKASFYMTSDGGYIENGNAYHYWYDASSAEFTISYSYVYDDNVSDTSGTITNTNATKFKFANSFELTTPTNTNSKLTFMGWFTDPSCSEEYLIQNFDGALFVGSDVKLYGLWTEEKPYTISFVTNKTDIKIGDVSKLPKDMATFDPLTNSTIHNAITKYDNDVTKTQYFGGWYLDESCTIEYTSESIEDYVVNNKISLYAKWSNKWSITVTTTRASVTISVNGGASNPVSDKIYVMDGDAISITATAENDKIDTFTVTDKTTTKGNKIETCEIESVNSNISINVVGNNKSCIVEGTLVTLADGTKKAVEDLTYEDKLLVFNHYTGEIETGYVAMLDHLGVEKELRKVVNLEFSNGEVLRTVWAHGIFDCTLNEYVFITEENATDYVGHEFFATEYDGTKFVESKVTLIKAYVTEEEIKVYNPTSLWHMNYFASGILNVTAAPSVIYGHVNYFELDENMKYDEEKMQEDIEKYGLYTYEDFAEYLTEEQFNALPFCYLKVSVGKGLITWDGIMDIIEYLKDGELI